MKYKISTLNRWTFTFNNAVSIVNNFRIFTSLSLVKIMTALVFMELGRRQPNVKTLYTD